MTACWDRDTTGGTVANMPWHNTHPQAAPSHLQSTDSCPSQSWYSGSSSVDSSLPGLELDSGLTEHPGATAHTLPLGQSGARGREAMTHPVSLRLSGRPGACPRPRGEASGESVFLPTHPLPPHRPGPGNKHSLSAAPLRWAPAREAAPSGAGRAGGRRARHNALLAARGDTVGDLGGLVVLRTHRIAWAGKNLYHQA